MWSSSALTFSPERLWFGGRLSSHWQQRVGDELAAEIDLKSVGKPKGGL